MSINIQFHPRWALRLIGVVLFAYFLHRIGLERLGIIMKAIHPGLFLLAVPIFFVMLAVKAIKIQTMLAVPVEFAYLFRVNAFSFSIGAFTPGRLGEFTKIVYLTRAGVPRASAILATLIDRIQDVFFLYVWALVGVFHFFGAGAGAAGLALLVLGLLACGSLLKSGRSILRFVPARWREMLETEWDNLARSLRELGWRPLAVSAAWTILYLGIYFFQMWLVAQSLRIHDLDYFSISLMIAAGSLTALLPISIAGVGSRDAVLILLFQQYAWSGHHERVELQGLAVAFSTLILFLFILNGLSGLCFSPDKK